jgi:hypothetical protein
MKPIDVAIDELSLDARLQMRVNLDFAAIDEYAEHLDELPPCKAVRNHESIWPTSGWHRIHAFQKQGRTTIPCFVREGSFIDALVEACGENSDHGIRRTPEDKARAVRALLNEPTWAAKSDRLVAEACKVGHPFVAKIRSEMIPIVVEKDDEKPGGIDSTCPDEPSGEPEKPGGIDSTCPDEPSGEPEKPETRTGKDGKSYPVAPKILCSGCQRKQRTNQPVPKICLNCKDAREKAKPKSADDDLPKSVAKAEKVIHDREAGVDEEMTIEEEIKAKNSKIESFCRRLTAMIDEIPSDEWLDDMGRREGARQKIRDAAGTLRTGKCHAPCPQCKGEGKVGGKKCRICHGTGRLPKSNYDQAV